MSTTMISTQTPTFQGALDNIPPPPVDISPLVVRKTKRVSFYPEAFVRYTTHLNNYTAEEKRRTWLTLDELRRMKKSCQRLALELSEVDDQSEHGDDDDDRCIRGLEGRTRQGISKRRRVRYDAKNAVLWEQGRQRRWGESVDGLNDDTIIADTYYEYTECAQIEAHMVGLRDASEAVSVWEESDSATDTTTATTTATTYKNTTTTTTTSNSSRIPKPYPDPRVTNGSSRLINLQSMSRLSSSRRLLTDAFFQV